MIYLDTSVALAWMLGEGRHPPERLWGRPLVASRLLQYELWTRLHARGLAATGAPLVEEVLARVLLIELAPIVLARVNFGFPVPVRTLDAMHLATALYVAEQRQSVSLASYDARLVEAAAAVGIVLADDIG